MVILRADPVSPKDLNVYFQQALSSCARLYAGIFPWLFMDRT